MKKRNQDSIMSWTLQIEVSNYAAAVKAKAIELYKSLTAYRAEQDKLNYKKAKDEAAEKAEQEKLNEEKARKLKKVEIYINNIVSKIDEFKSINDTIKPSKNLSYHEVINHMLKISDWKQKQNIIDDVKIKLNKGLIDLDTEPIDYVLVKEDLKI